MDRVNKFLRPISSLTVGQVGVMALVALTFILALKDSGGEREQIIDVAHPVSQPLTTTTSVTHLNSKGGRTIFCNFKHCDSQLKSRINESLLASLQNTDILQKAPYRLTTQEMENLPIHVLYDMADANEVFLRFSSGEEGSKMYESLYQNTH